MRKEFLNTVLSMHINKEIYRVDLSNGDSGICPIAFLTKTSAMDEYSSKMLLNNVTTKSLSGKKSPEYRTITTTTITVHRDEDDTPTQEAVNKRYRVIRSRLAQKASELTLSAGDYVLVSIIYSDGMVYGCVSFFPDGSAENGANVFKNEHCHG